MRFFFRSLAVRVAFVFTFYVHFGYGQLEDTDGKDIKVSNAEHEKTPDGVFGFLHLKRSRRSAGAAAHSHSAHSHSHDHSNKGHSSHGAHHAHDDGKTSKTAADHGKARGKDKDAATAAASAVTDKNKTVESAKEDPKHEAVAKADEEKDANENYDDDTSVNSDVIHPPSPPEVMELSDTSVELKWTSGSLRDKGVKGYKVEYLKGNTSKVFGGLHPWHTVANRIRPKFRMFKVEHLQPEMSYRFRIATIYAGNKYMYGPASGWTKMLRWS